MKWRTYTAYKDSGTEWLGEIPQHWETKRLRHVVFCLDGRRIPLNAEQRGYMQGDYPYWGANGVVDSVNDWLFNEPLVLLGEDGAPFFDNAKNVAFFVTGKIWINNHIHVLKINPSIEPIYLSHILNVTDYTAFIDGTTRDKLTQEKMKDIPIIVPPNDEQQAIQRFLGYETSRIDELIAKKQRQIELLQEKRSALINHAVTKGLDPNVKMKDSDIDGLGDIPDDWHVFQFRRVISSLEQGWSPVADDRQAENDEWAVLKISAVAQGRFRPGEHKALPPGLEPETRYEIRPGDFLVTRSNTPEKVGDACCVSETRHRLIMSDLIYRLRLDQRRCLHHFACYWLISRAGRAAIEADARGTSGSMVKIAQSHIRAWPILIPPVEEQDALVQYLDRKLHCLDEIVVKIEASIHLLREYRTALISAAVTGKIDVREEVA